MCLCTDMCLRYVSEICEYVSVMPVHLQMHLRDSVAATRLDELMPNALGMSWGEAIGSTSIIMHQTQTYFRQLESVVARWEATSDFSVLQPAAPWPQMALRMLNVEQVKAAGQKEVCLSNNTHRCIHLASQWCDPSNLVLVCLMGIPDRVAGSLVRSWRRQGLHRQLPE